MRCCVASLLSVVIGVPSAPEAKAEVAVNLTTPRTLSTGYIKHKGKTVSGHDYKHPGAPMPPWNRIWRSYSELHYDVVTSCGYLCDGHSECKGFVDQPNGDCIFKTSASVESQSSLDFYEKTDSPAGGDLCDDGGWPRFRSKDALDKDPWGAYFRKVYGTLPPFEFPLCIGDFWFFYDDLIDKTGVSVPTVWANCPSPSTWDMQRYRQNNMYQPSGVSFAWHGPPYHPFAANTWVEVDHRQDPFGDENVGMWLLYAKGNGIWFYTGKTTSFGEHSEAYSHFGVSGFQINDAVSRAAASQGYDSIQFLRHVDHVNYPCDKTAKVDYMNIEIVAVKLTGKYSCGSSSGAPENVIAAGWEGSRTCECDNALGNLNCQGVPALESGRRRRAEVAGLRAAVAV